MDPATRAAIPVDRAGDIRVERAAAILADRAGIRAAREDIPEGTAAAIPARIRSRSPRRRV